MQPIRVSVLEASTDHSGLDVYASETARPSRLGIGDEVGPGVLYEPILDLPENGPSEGPATALFVVGIDLGPGHETDFEAWYNIEHLPALANVAGVNRAVRYRRANSQDESNDDYPAYLALYDVTSLDIPGNPDWVAAVETPWTQRVRPHFTARWRGGYTLQPR